MPPAGFEPTIPAPQAHALDRTATGIGNVLYLLAPK